MTGAVLSVVGDVQGGPGERENNNYSLVLRSVYVYLLAVTEECQNDQQLAQY